MIALLPLHLLQKLSLKDSQGQQNPNQALQDAAFW